MGPRQYFHSLRAIKTISRITDLRSNLPSYFATASLTASHIFLVGGMLSMSQRVKYLRTESVSSSVFWEMPEVVETIKFLCFGYVGTHCKVVIFFTA